MDFPLSFYIILGAFGLILVIFVIAGIAATGSTLKDIYHKISLRVGGRIVSPRFGAPYLSCIRKGIECRVFFMSGSQYSAPQLRIRFLKKMPFTLSFYRAGRIVRFLNGLGLLRTVKSSLDQLDPEFLVFSNNTIACERYLDSKGTRKFLSLLAGNGWQINFNKKMIELSKPLKSGKNDFRLASATDLIDIDEVSEIIEHSPVLFEDQAA